jgi:hypothetical protein
MEAAWPHCCAAEIPVQGPVKMERRAGRHRARPRKLRGFVLALLADVATCLLLGSQLCQGSVVLIRPAGVTFETSGCHCRGSQRSPRELGMETHRFLLV